MKRFALAVTLIGCCSFAQADANSAIALAQQAGVIAGAAEACGQNVSVLNERIQEAINVMVPEQTERTRAGIVYGQSYNSAKVAEKAHAKIPCNQVLKDFNSLPILRADYKQSVLPTLRDPQPAAPQAAQPARHNQTPPAAQPSLPSQNMPQNGPSLGAPAQPGAPSNPIMPGATPPAPQFNPAVQTTPGVIPNTAQQLTQPQPTPVIPQANTNVGY